MDCIEVTGRVTRIAKDKSHFSVFVFGEDKLTQINNPFNSFCLLQENDSVYALCSENEGQLTLIRSPIVELPKDKESIIKTLFKILRYKKISQRQTQSLYDLLRKVSDDPCALLDKWSVHVVDQRDTSTSDSLLGALTKIQYEALMNGWYKQRVMRSLYLLNLTNREIKDCLKLASILNENDVQTHELRQKIIDDPIVLYTLPISKRRDILERQRKDTTEDENYCLAVVDFLFKRLNERRWSSVPMNTVQAEFPAAIEHTKMLGSRFGIRAEFKNLYLPHVYSIEKYVAETISRLIVRPCLQRDVQFKRDDLSEDQKTALKGSLGKNFSMIHGPAGSGKTSIIQEILYNHDLWGKPYILTSFTGKAVGRMKQLTGIVKKAHTIHRFLHSSKAKKVLTHNMTVVIDEISMVTTELFYDFLKLLEPYKGIRFILVGDNNQLPPISWGSLMENCLASKKVPRYVLTKNHRLMKGDDAIMANSQAILNPPMFNPETDNPNEYKEFDFVTGKNFSIIEGDLGTVDLLLKRLHSSNIKDDSFTIISPYNKDLSTLNRMVQEIFNKDNKPVTDGAGVEWRKDDRVMMTVNNYEIGVMNGDEGRVISTAIDELTIKFNDNSKEFTFSLHHINQPDIPQDIENEDVPETFLSTKLLILGTAITCHKSQGSENDIIIIYIPAHQAQNFVNRNLMYTAVTRSRKAVFMIGDIQTMKGSVYKKQLKRVENLVVRIDSNISDATDGHLFTVSIGEEVIYVTAVKDKAKKIGNLCIPFGRRTQVHQYKIDDIEIEMKMINKVTIMAGFHRGQALHSRSTKPIIGNQYVHLLTLDYHGGPEIFLVKDTLNSSYKTHGLTEDYVLSSIVIGPEDEVIPDFIKLEDVYEALEHVEEDDEVVEALKELGYVVNKTDFSELVRQFAR
jgi:hypothetical protein